MMSIIQNMPQSIHNFVTLLFADFVSSMGSSLTGFALMLAIYGNTRNLMVTALFSLITVAPRIIITYFFSDVYFKGSFKKIFAVGELTCIIPLIVLLWSDNLIVVYVAYFVYSAVFFELECLRAEYLKQIATDDNMQRFQSASNFANTLVTIIGPLAAGIILSKLGLKMIFTFDIVTYVFAAIVILGLKGDYKPERKTDIDREKVSFRRAIADNYDVFSGAILITFVGGAVSLLTLEYIYKVMNGSEMQYSILMSLMAVGSLIGSTLGGTIFAGKNLKVLSRVCTVVMGALLLSVILKPAFIVLAIILLISGIFSTLIMIYYSVELFTRNNTSNIRKQYAIFQNIIDVSNGVSKPFGAMINRVFGSVISITILGGVFITKGILKK
jgi:MFS transporter, DHA3 family, macrolide efflux protein